MPPYPWHLGGRRYHNMFVECEDFKLWHEMTGLFFCIDYSHSFLASKYLNIPFEEYISKIKKYSSYFHIADADGDDGEGLQILEGEINFKSLYSEILVDEKFQFIPEIWQGHIDNFEGFKLALQKLRHLGW
jgi:N-acetylneuraminate synthase